MAKCLKIEIALSGNRRLTLDELSVKFSRIPRSIVITCSNHTKGSAGNYLKREELCDYVQSVFREGEDVTSYECLLALTKCMSNRYRHFERSYTQTKYIERFSFLSFRNYYYTNKIHRSFVFVFLLPPCVNLPWLCRRKIDDKILKPAKIQYTNFLEVSVFAQYILPSFGVYSRLRFREKF